MKPRANASRRVVTAIVLATVAILLPAAACAGSAGNSFPTCKKIRIMSVGAVRSHTGIPSFTAH